MSPICARGYWILGRKLRLRVAYRWLGDDLDLTSNWNGKRFVLYHYPRKYPNCCVLIGPNKLEL